jgi:Fe-S cluster assembly protein SufD
MPSTVHNVEAASEPVGPIDGGFEAARERLPGAGREWAEALRLGGIAAFRSQGLPSRKWESFKYTDLRGLAKLELVQDSIADAAARPLPGWAAAEVDARADAPHLAVFVNGVFRPELSRLDDLPAGVRAAGLAALLDDGDPLAEEHVNAGRSFDDRPMLALNAALMQDGLAVALAPGAVLEAPIELLHLTVPHGALAAAHPRHLLVAGPNASATLIETAVGPDGEPYLHNAAWDILLEEGARLRHYREQRDGAGAYALTSAAVAAAKDASYDAFALTLGAAVTRNELLALLTGPGGDVSIDGAYLGEGKQLIDNTVRVEHREPDGRSRQVVRGVLDDQARGVFQGKIAVTRAAQRTDAHQLSNALLLSKAAEADNKPELEIFADDVKCSHGATSGEVDDQAIFYLRSRGIGEDEARALLVEAFLQEAIDEIADETVRARFAELVRGRLRARAERKAAA